MLYQQIGGAILMEFELSVIKETMKRASDKCLEGVDISSINENDVKVFDYINSEGINDTELLNETVYWDMAKDITVESMEDLIARIVLSRPGLEEKCKEFINNKKNPDSINYGCEELEHILAPTYGCIIYQEQIIQILIELAGYSEKQSELVRSDMAKKARKNYESYKNEFVSGNKVGNIPGCVAKRISKEVAEKLYDDMWKAASYCFNKSHATSYATLAYRIAWLKCYYKDEYMDALEQMKASSESKQEIHPLGDVK